MSRGPRDQVEARVYTFLVNAPEMIRACVVGSIPRALSPRPDPKEDGR